MNRILSRISISISEIPMEYCWGRGTCVREAYGWTIHYRIVVGRCLRTRDRDGIASCIGAACIAGDHTNRIGSGIRIGIGRVLLR